MKIQVLTAGADVVLRITPGYPLGDRFFDLRWGTGSEWGAQLLWQMFDRALGARLEAIRKEAYAQGWRDAKSKKTKRTWFSSGWGLES